MTRRHGPLQQLYGWLWDFSPHAPQLSKYGVPANAAPLHLAKDCIRGWHEVCWHLEGCKHRT